MTIDNDNVSASFDKDFCSYLEYHLTRVFTNSSDNELKDFWCDGIATPFNDIESSEKNIIETKAWIGITGQDIYQMSIHLGPCSLNNCLNRTGLIECLPPNDSLDWVSIDIEKRTILLQLK